MRILKFDMIHPSAYIHQKKAAWGNIDQLSRKEYLQKILDFRINFSDYYTYHLQQQGWEAEEFLVNDDTYYEKVAKELFGSKLKLTQLKESLKDKIRPTANRWKKHLMATYIRQYKPDVIFVREPSHIDSDFWRTFSAQSLLVSRNSAFLTPVWHPRHWDLIYTSTPEYKVFFELNNVPSIINANGFDKRVIQQLTNQPKQYDITFVGGLNYKTAKIRTSLMETISQSIDFKWWGYGHETLPENDLLKKNWQGLTSGLDMFQICKDSRIVLNDYVDMANGHGVNQRIFEVLGSGTFMLTREAANLKTEFPENLFVTFKDKDDCIDKINYYLKNEAEREEIAQNGQQFILQNYSYQKLMETISEQLLDHYNQKFKTQRVLHKRN